MNPAGRGPAPLRGENGLKGAGCAISLCSPCACAPRWRRRFKPCPWRAASPRPRTSRTPATAAGGCSSLSKTASRGSSVTARLRRSRSSISAAKRAPAASETVLLRIAQPFSNHNGGQLRFGPDGHLYIGMGDGGSGGDPQNNGQNLGTPLGKLLRVDVESDPGRLQIPADNPFVSRAGARGEIWAYGLRNAGRGSSARSNSRGSRRRWPASIRSTSAFQ
ncbi:MAG TPA: PQQ-dependent sugar dehydrogenase [Bryobacteraceae bacterium]|nr:PQQ-dependent sugar dehydrogenase [Bryobacteraceae bacterium]